MGLEVKWHDTEQTILVATIAQDTTWHDYHVAIDLIIRYAAAANHRVDVIFLDDVGMPRGNPLLHLQQGASKLMQQHNIHLCLVAGSQGSTGYARSVIEIVGRIFTHGKTPHVFEPTLEAAVARIQAHRLGHSSQPPRPNSYRNPLF
ncbi:MAG: hypothetical protein U0694_22890 [Anaerolineae bacterium]